MVSMVGAARFELATPWSQTRCATRLRQAPQFTPAIYAGIISRQRYKCKFYLVILKIECAVKTHCRALGTDASPVQACAFAKIRLRVWRKTHAVPCNQSPARAGRKNSVVSCTVTLATSHERNIAVAISPSANVLKKPPCAMPRPLQCRFCKRTA